MLTFLSIISLAITTIILLTALWMYGRGQKIAERDKKIILPISIVAWFASAVYLFGFW